MQTSSVEAPADPLPDRPAPSRTSFQDQLEGILHDFFSVDDATFARTLADAAVFLEVAPGERLFRQGDPSDDVYIVLKGRLRAIREDGPGAPSEIGDIARGETFGELGFILNEPRMASVVAVRATVLAKIDHQWFRETLKTRPEIALEVMRIIVTRVRNAERAVQRPRRPVTICLVAISRNVDLRALADELVRHMSPYGGVVALGRREAEARFAAADVDAPRSLHSEVSLWIDDEEAAHAAVLLLADATATGWSRRCVDHAEEIVLVGDGDGDPAASEIETALLEPRAIARLTGRTLLLLHRPDKRSPIGTRRWLDGRDLARHIHVRRGDERHLRRLARLLSGRAVGIVLSGGGARGFAHIGVLQALHEAGIEPDLIGGASIGAVIGAWQAMDVSGGKMAAAARRCFVEGGNPIGDYNVFPFVSLVAGRKVRKLTEQAVREAAGSDIDVEDTWVTFFCVAADYSASSEVILDHGPLARAALASFAIPGMLPPIVIDGHLHIDGGAINNMPVDAMEAYRPHRIVAVELLKHEVKSVDYERVPSTGALLRNGLTGGSLRTLKVPPITEILVRSGLLGSAIRQRELRERADLCIRPELPRIGLVDWSKYEAAVAGGLQSARDAIAELDGESVESFR